MKTSAKYLSLAVGPEAT